MFLLCLTFLPLQLAPLSAFAKEDTESAPVVIQSMTKLMPRLEARFSELKPGDLVVLDLDNTVFRETQMLGTDEWYSHELQKRIAAGESKHDATRSLEPFNIEIKKRTQMRLMEPGIPDLIFELQRRGVMVIGLTARHPKLAMLTHSHLRRLGVDFTLSKFPGEVLREDRLPQLHNAFLFSGNIAFTDGSPKGLVLTHLIQKTGIRPSRVLAIDDRIYHVHTFVEALLALGIPGHVIHYLRYQQEEPFDARVADLQFDIFKRNKRLISDDAARLLLDGCEQLL